ncbi:MAG: TetR/AcrR family transcriptional regulator [Clostridia bacterium]|nr:TetR/AcrR family transcriptional regulator [Clostridia bacterium]
MPKTPERCQEIREETKKKILRDSMLYFARNGFAGTKISDLSGYIGIGQGTMYLYFKSKEDLFKEIFAICNNDKEIKDLKILSRLPISAKKKIKKLSETVIAKLEQNENYAAKVTLTTQVLFEKDGFSSESTTYQSEIYKYTAKIIEQGQKEKSVVGGSSMKLADFYWSVVYLYALKKLFTTKYETLTVADLERVLLKDENKNE